MSDTSVWGCIGGAAVKKNRVCRVIALFVLFGAFGAAGAAADEMTVAPAAFITAPTGQFQWTGFYVGANGGYGWSSSSVTYSPNDVVRTSQRKSQHPARRVGRVVFRRFLVFLCGRRVLFCRFVIKNDGRLGGRRRQ
jgi:hypothetical protein